MKRRYSYLIVADGTVKGHRRTREQADRLAACYTDATISVFEGRLFSHSGQIKNAAAYEAAKTAALAAAPYYGVAILKNRKETQ